MEKKESPLKQSFHRNVRQYTMVIALVGIWLIFTFLTGFIFIEPRNLSNLFLQTVTVAIVAVGMTLVIVTGNIDLSVGSVAGFAGAVGAVLQVKLGWPTVPAIAAALATGLLIGGWHGFWIAHRKVPSFIVTLASMMIFRGGILGITGGATVSPLANSFKMIGQNYLSPVASSVLAAITIALFVASNVRKRSQRRKYGLAVPSVAAQLAKIVSLSLIMAAFFCILIFNQGIPYAVLLLMVLALVFNFVANNTVFGRHLYAIGGNEDAARLSGINIANRITILFVLFGGLTAVAGVVLTARLNAATTSAGTGMELDVIAASVLGGTSLMGGRGTIFGALIGALIMASLDNGMSLMNLDITYQYVIKGLILLVAVWVDVATQKK